MDHNFLFFRTKDPQKETVYRRNFDKKERGFFDPVRDQKFERRFGCCSG